MKRLRRLKRLLPVLLLSPLLPPVTVLRLLSSFPLSPPPPSALCSSLLQLKWCLYPMHIGTFKFNTFALVVGPPLLLLGAVLARRVSDTSFLFVFSELRNRGSEFLEPEPDRRTCQTGLLRPRWTPGRPGLLGHFLDLDSPAELLREHGALLTFRVDPEFSLGRVVAVPADLLRENGHMLMFNSAELAPAVLLFLSLSTFFFSFSFSFSFSFDLSSWFFLSLFLKMSRHLFDVEDAAVDSGAVITADNSSGPGPGSGSGLEEGGSGSGWGVWLRRWRGRRTPLSKSWSAERRLGCGKDGFRTIQNSNSGDVEQLPLLLLPLLLGERIWAAAGLSVGLSIERERERERERWVWVWMLRELSCFFPKELWVQSFSASDPTSNKQSRMCS